VTEPQLPTRLNAEPGHARVRTTAGAGDVAGVIAALDTAGISWRDDDVALDDHSRDWWPVTIGWAAHGELPARPSIVVSPTSTNEVARAVAACAAAGIPVTAQGGRSGVCGGAVPDPGAVVIELTGLAGVLALDRPSLRARVAAGTFGPELEAALRAQGCTLGHFPQSMDLSTVGGWVACRGAGQYSTRYGKIEDLVRGLTVVLADGSVITTGGAGPREAVGPDLTQLFVGSEGTLGIVTEVELVLHPLAPEEARAAWSFTTFADGLEACRRILQRGATPAVLRLYDEVESARSFGVERCVLVVLDEADRALLDATMAIVHDECRTATVEDAALVAAWLERRNDVSALGPLWERGIVVDTIETAATWGALSRVHDSVVAAIRSIEATTVASVHQSHAYLDGACLYFTFAGRPEDPDAYYRAVWDAATLAALGAGASLSHHHGIGRNRARHVRRALGPAFDVLSSLKHALDPQGILNPGVLGLGEDRLA
jgi:alkyldihydroxyacetonephosphate synthase